MTVARFLRLLIVVPSVAGLLLSTTAAYSQATNSQATNSQATKPEDRKKNCRVLTAKRGESAREVPDKELTPGQAGNFPYLIDDTHLRADFQVERDRRRGCMSFFGIQNAASAAGAAGAAAAAAAPGGVAAVGAGIGAVSAGAIAAGAFVVIATGAAIGVASGGGTPTQTNSTTSTTTPP